MQDHLAAGKVDIRIELQRLRWAKSSAVLVLPNFPTSSKSQPLIVVSIIKLRRRPVGSQVEPEPAFGQRRQVRRVNRAGMELFARAAALALRTFVIDVQATHGLEC